MLNGAARIESTGEVLMEILQNEGDEILYHIQEDMAKPLIDRVRVCLSRARKNLRQNNKLVRHFRLYARILENAGEDKEAGEVSVLFWIGQTTTEKLIDEIEREIGNL